MKAELLKSSAGCHLARLNEGSCREFCAQVRSLAEERQSCVLFARKWHLLGGWAAELFDSARHVKQDESHLESLTLGPQWRF